MPYRTGTLIRFKGSSTKPVCSAGECDRQAADTGFKRKLKAVHTRQSTQKLASMLLLIRQLSTLRLYQSITATK